MNSIVENSYKHGYQDGYIAALDRLEMTLKMNFNPYDANCNDIENILYLISVLRWSERNNGGVKNYE